MLALDPVQWGENCIPPDVGERDKLSHILFFCVISVSDVGDSSKPQITPLTNSALQVETQVGSRALTPSFSWFPNCLMKPALAITLPGTSQGR